MGNCQTAESATVLIQTPEGRVQRLYWAIAASEVMSANPGHYVAAVLTAPPSSAAAGKASSAPVKHLKLLRPDDTLCVGRVYRLVTFQEVLKELSSKNQSRLSRLRLAQQQVQEKKMEKEKTTDGGLGSGRCREGISQPSDRSSATAENRGRRRQQQEEEEGDGHLVTAEGGSIAGGGSGSRFAGGSARHGQWRPSLQSISEVGGM